MKTVLLVDLWNVFMVSWHAGANKEARWPFTDTMGRIRAEARKHDHCAIMTDGGRSFRNDLDARWKKNRDEKHAGAVFMLAEVERALDEEGFHVFKVEEMEADDLIATAVHQMLLPRHLVAASSATTACTGCGLQLSPDGACPLADLLITIHSSDRDMLGLLEPGVQILRTVAPPPPKPGAPPGPPKSRIVRAEDVRQNPKIGVDPPKVRDFLVLADDHNGIKYFPGIGPVHAAKLLNEHGDLSTILSKVDTIDPPSIRVALQKAMGELVDDRPLIDVAVQIVTLRKDAPIDIMTIFQKKEPRPPGPTWDEDDGETRDLPSGQCGRATGDPPGIEHLAHGDIRHQPEGEPKTGGGDILSTGSSVASGKPLLGTAAIPRAGSEGVSDGANAPAEQLGSAHSGGNATGGPLRARIEKEAVVGEPVGGDKGPSGGSGTEAPRATRNEMAGLVIAPRWELSLEPATLGEAFRLARMAFASGFWPKHGTEAGCMMIIMAGRARGLTAFDSLNGMHIIEGQPRFGAYLLIGMVQRAKECAYFELVESDQSHALWISKRKGSKTEQRRGYSVEDARRAELVRPRSNWEKHPEDMCIKTAGAKLTRAAWAFITSGAVAAEEMGYE